MLNRSLSVRLSICVVFISFITVGNSPSSVYAAKSANYRCGGSVEKQTWNLWDTAVRRHISEQLIEKDLIGNGDTYALYNFQTYVHNLASMAMRCQRRERVREISVLVERTYSTLVAAPSGGGRQWTCGGGAVCNSTNGLINKEVMLTSVQFLGLASQLANWLTLQPGKLSQAEARFVRSTAEVVVEHMLRWRGPHEGSIRGRIGASSQDVWDGFSNLFFTDKELWMIGIYSGLAGMLESGYGKQKLVDLLDSKQRAMVKGHVGLLMQFFKGRIITETLKTRDGKAVVTADIDRGFWRRYADNRYAGYIAPSKPVVCERTEDGNVRLRVLVPQSRVLIVENIGWDFSHARRLVYVLDSFEKNRDALVKAFSIPESDMPQSRLAEAFANKLVVSIWNGNSEYPLFSNYWSGANGWYRVAYDNGTGQCREGTPPYGLSISFPTGGYTTWGRSVPKLSELGRRLHVIFSSQDPKAIQFVETYYPGFGNKTSQLVNALNEIMFLPSLVFDETSKK